MDGDGDIDCPYKFKNSTKPSSSTHAEKENSKSSSNSTPSNQSKANIFDKFIEWFFRDDDSAFISLIKLIVFIALWITIFVAGVAAVCYFIVFIKWIFKRKNK